MYQRGFFAVVFCSGGFWFRTSSPMPISLAMGSPLYLAVRFVDGGTVPFCSEGCDELRSKLLSPGSCEPGIAEPLEHRHFSYQVCLVGFQKKIPKSILP